MPVWTPWISALVHLRPSGSRKTVLVRIVDAETDTDGRVWFWARYA